jgi:hypothetical protein
MDVKYYNDVETDASRYPFNPSLFDRCKVEEVLAAWEARIRSRHARVQRMVSR